MTQNDFILRKLVFIAFLSLQLLWLSYSLANYSVLHMYVGELRHAHQ